MATSIRIGDHVTVKTTKPPTEAFRSPNQCGYSSLAYLLENHAKHAAYEKQTGIVLHIDPDREQPMVVKMPDGVVRRYTRTEVKAAERLSGTETSRTQCPWVIIEIEPEVLEALQPRLKALNIVVSQVHETYDPTGYREGLETIELTGHRLSLEFFIRQHWVKTHRDQIGGFDVFAADYRVATASHYDPTEVPPTVEVLRTSEQFAESAK